MSDQHALRAYLLLFITTACWGLNAIISRLAVNEIAPMQLVTFRWLGVILILALFARRHVIRDWPVLRHHLPFLGLMGGCGFTGFNAFFYVAGHHTTAINIGILQGSIPIFVLLGTVLVLGHSVGFIQIAGVAITLLGVIIIASGGQFADIATFSFNHGELLMLVACFFYAAYSVGLSRRPNVSALGLFAVMAFSAWVTSLPLVAIESFQIGWQSPTLIGWGLVLLVTLLPSLIAQLFFIQGVALIGPGRAGVFVNLVPVFASIMAVVLLQEVFELYHAIAMALVLGGIWLSEIGKPQPPFAPNQQNST